MFVSKHQFYKKSQAITDSERKWLKVRLIKLFLKRQNFLITEMDFQNSVKIRFPEDVYTFLLSIEKI